MKGASRDGGTKKYTNKSSTVGQILIASASIY